VNLRPGWDLAFEGGLIVELDEELHIRPRRSSRPGRRACRAGTTT
jgi:hypothetical protein